MDEGGSPTDPFAVRAIALACFRAGYDVHAPEDMELLAADLRANREFQAARRSRSRRAGIIMTAVVAGATTAAVGGLSRWMAYLAHALPGVRR